MRFSLEHARIKNPIRSFLEAEGTQIIRDWEHRSCTKGSGQTLHNNLKLFQRSSLHSVPTAVWCYCSTNSVRALWTLCSNFDWTLIGRVVRFIRRKRVNLISNKVNKEYEEITLRKFFAAHNNFSCFKKNCTTPNILRLHFTRELI